MARRRYTRRTYYDEDTDNERLQVPEESTKVPDPVYGRVVGTSSLIIRKGPSQTSDAVALIDRQDRFEILDQKILGFDLNGRSCYFERIKFKEKTGYIMSKYCEKEGESLGNQ